MTRGTLIAGLVLGAFAAPAVAEDLYAPGNWAAMSADRRASAAGDTITVVINQAAEAANVAQNSSRKSSDLGGGIEGGGLSENGKLRLDSGYTGRGEVRRSDRLTAQLTVTIDRVLSNGDYLIVGRQAVRINGERTDIAVKGRIRAEDIAAGNRVLSSRIADAEISYDGKGFVSRSARPGLVSRLFNLFGLL